MASIRARGEGVDADAIGMAVNSPFPSDNAPSARSRFHACIPDVGCSFRPNMLRGTARVRSTIRPSERDFTHTGHGFHQRGLRAHAGDHLDKLVSQRHTGARADAQPSLLSASFTSQMPRPTAASTTAAKTVTAEQMAIAARPLPPGQQTAPGHPTRRNSVNRLQAGAADGTASLPEGSIHGNNAQS